MFWPPQFSIAIFRCDQLCLCLPGQIHVPDDTTVYAPQVNYTIPNTNVDNGKNALFVSTNAANPKLKTALDLVGYPSLTASTRCLIRAA